MPTYDWLPRFLREYRKLNPSQVDAWKPALELFIEGLRQGGSFHHSLRVKHVQGAPGVWEMSWADDGRATFHYGPEQRPGERHVVWRRIGTHDIFRRP